MGILGKVAPTLTEYTLAYAVPTAKKAVVTIAITNKSTADNTIYVALSGSKDLGVSSITATNPGTGLTSKPTLTISGTGTGASAVVSTLVMTAVGISSGGTGYVVGDVITVVGGTGTSAELTVASVDANGAVLTVNITNPGAYSAVISGTTAATTGGTGVDAVVNVTAVRYGIGTIEVTNAGNDYTSVPSITTSAGTGAVFDVQMTRAAIQDNDAIEWNVTIPPSGVLERTGVTLSDGDAIFVKSSVANGLNTFVFGVEAIA